MGATAADTQREIEEIRKDVSSAVRELKRRIRRALSPSTYAEMAREHPAAVAGLGLGAVSVAGALVARSVVESRRRNRPSERLRRTVMGAAEGLSEQLERARSAMPLEVRIGTRHAEQDDSRQAALAGSDPGMVKRMLWAALVAVMMAGGGLLARRLSATIWKTAMGEAPPTKNV